MYLHHKGLKPHDNPRKEEFHGRLISMNTLCCGLTSILWRPQILEVIEIFLKNLTKSNPLSEGCMQLLLWDVLTCLWNK